MLTFIRQRTILFVLLLGLVSTACIPITEEDFANSPEGVQTILQAFFAYFTSSSTDVVAENTSSSFAANSAAPIVLSTNVQDFSQAGTTAAGGPNENCPAGTAELAKFNWNDSTSTYDLEGVNNGGVVISGDEISGTWTSTRPISHVLIKGALEVDTDVYSPPATSGSFDNSEIFTPNQPNNADISNIKFCGPTRGTISVEKLVSTGDPNTPNQTFTLNILTAGGTTLNSDDSITNGGILSSSELSAGAYVVSETDLAANWSLDDLSCSSEYGNSSIGVASLGSNGGSIAITLGAGDIVYCIASNSFELPPELVDIRVIKYNDLNQNGDNDEVNIGPSGGPTGNTLTGWQFVLYNGQGTEIAAGTTFAENPSSPNDLGIRVTFADLPKNDTYTICEVPQAGWVNSDPGANTDPDPTGQGRPCETINTSNAGNIAIRYFGNYQLLGSITILKNVDDDSFADTPCDFLFDGSTNFATRENDGAYVISDLPAGSYTVQETVPANWDLTSIGCNVPNNNTALSDGLTIVL
ncbi:MAG: hypothetical protein KC708_22585, partial [Anaerolineae bacterium]|nr:hypothetical protein [Anaerolineae bacterium]